MDEYIVVNKTKLEAKLKDLISEGDKHTKMGSPDSINLVIQQEKVAIREVILLSTPLLPIVVDARQSGINATIHGYSISNEEYFNNLKLSI